MTGRYARAARALLDWTQADLATRARIGVRTVKRFENDEETTPVVTAAIERAFGDAGLQIFQDARDLQKTPGEIGVAIVLDMRQTSAGHVHPHASNRQEDSKKGVGAE